MGSKKTAERIRCSFYWVGMTREVHRFCQACVECQQTRGVRTKDRCPITPVARPELPFQVVNVDVIGPIDPPSARGHKYILCVVDQHTRWAEAIPLTSLTAKATCEALLTVFMRTGVPNVIASDNATNFSAELTKEFEKRMGASPRFSTPAYPQSNGLVERFNRTLKSMLHHVVIEEPRSWHTKLPFVLWAYREVPNSTTGVAPFQLLYGRKPQGPLSILKNVWTGEQEGVQTSTIPVTKYLEKLKARLEWAADKANLISAVQQERMAHYHNLRSTRKTFELGDRVLVLIPDSCSKLWARWQGPGVIEAKKNEHSFSIRMLDGTLRQVHQNKIRKFIAESGAVNVIFEGEEEFGDVESIPLLRELNEFAEELRVLDWEHLRTEQTLELKGVLRRFGNLFTRTLRPAKIGFEDKGKGSPMETIETARRKIGGGMHSPDSEKIAAIQRLEAPRTKKEVRSVLGLMGFYRSYIPNYAELAVPLTELTKGRKSGSVIWSDREETAFQGLKSALCKATALFTPVLDESFQLHADASDFAVGGCLTQKDREGNFKPIAFVSHKFNSTQKKWATIEKEAYAVLFSLKKFDKWLQGTSVEIITDHNPLKYLIEVTPRSPKLTRWALALQRWRYTITHRPGRLHLAADALSRLNGGTMETPRNLGTSSDRGDPSADAPRYEKRRNEKEEKEYAV